MKHLALLALLLLPLAHVHAQEQSGVSQEDMNELGRLMKVDPPEFCAAVPLIIKLDLAVATAQRAFFDGQTLTEKMASEAGYNTMEMTPPAPQLTKAQRIGLALQGIGSSLQQWAIYQNQLNLARAQRQIHCTTRAAGSNLTVTDCY